MSSSKRRTAPRMVERPGLRNIVTGSTRLCKMDPQHRTLEYCGYSVADLVSRSSFEEVAYLLLHGELPDGAQMAEFYRELDRTFYMPSILGSLVLALAAHESRAEPMQILRSLVSVYGANDMALRPSDAPLMRATHLLAIMPALIPLLVPGPHRANVFATAEREALNRWLPPGPLHNPSSASTFLVLLKGQEPTSREAELLDASLILYAEHEFNVGTHTLHAITSANADLYSAVCGAIGALSGDLHGGANEAALELLQEIGTPERIEEVLRAKMQTGTIKGFGHAVYKSGDPRCPILKPMVAALAREKGREDFYTLAETVEQTMLRIKKGRKLYPNIDFWIAVLYELLGIPKALFTPLFAMGRMAGWCAQYLEYRELNRTNGRLNLMRPRARYEGYASRPYLTIEERRPL